MVVILWQFAGYFLNSRTAIAGAIIGLLLVFRRRDFCYDDFKSAFCSFVHAISTEVRA